MHCWAVELPSGESHQLLGFLEAQLREGPDLLDDLDLGGSVKAIQLDVEFRLSFLRRLRSCSRSSGGATATTPYATRT